MFLDPSSWLFVLVALLGACVGSFLHVLALRWSEVLNQVPQAGLIQALSGRSACPSCHHTLKAWHMVPVVSFALLRGRCRSCHAPISWRYPAVEALTGVLFALGLIDTGYQFGGRNPEAGLDCSGMVSWIFDQAAGLKVSVEPLSTR